MTRDDLRAVDAEIDLCTDSATLELLFKRSKRWRRRAKRKDASLVPYIEVLQSKLANKIAELRSPWSMFELGTTNFKPGETVKELPLKVKAVHRIMVSANLSTDPTSVTVYGEPAEEGEEHW